MAAYKLTPAYKEYLWGGKKLIKKWKKNGAGELLAECWELSAHPDGQSLVDGVKLSEFLTAEKVGTTAADGQLPILVKLIDAKENLSVQVHPTTEYAAKVGAQAKTEFWYVLDADPGAGIYVGLKEDTDKEELVKTIGSKELLSKMNFFTVKKGEGYLIEAGTLHSIGAGITLLEVQQNSNTTYRVYDFDRVDRNGKPRELHIEDALNVIDCKKYIPKMGFSEISTPYFATRKISVNLYYKINAGEDSFIALFCIRGSARIDGKRVKKGETFLIPAGESAGIVGVGAQFLLITL